MVNDGDVSPRDGDGAPRPGSPQRDRISRRDRILGAMVAVIAKRGYEGASVELVCARAKVSRRTFYECFPSFEECFLAILDRGMETMAGVMLGAFAGEGEGEGEGSGDGDWLDTMLATEAAVLTFLDGEPEFARVLLVDALGAGSWALTRRQDNVGVLRDLIVERFRDTPLGGDFPPMAASGVMASLLGIMHEHLLHRRPEPLISLLGALMGVITAPYLSREDVAREVRRGEELAQRIRAEQACPQEGDAAGEGGDRDLEPVAMLVSPNAPRARECLLFIAEQGERGLSPSNGEVAVGIGVAHRSRVSTLLADLAAQGLVVKRSEGAGKRNAWRLTPKGETAVQQLR